MARILLIDDDHDYRGILKICLEGNGHEVTEAVNGASGIQLYTDNQFDLIITDLFMPKIDGINAIYRIMEEFNSPKIIAMTGSCSDDGNMNALEIAKAYGAKDVFRKADNIDKLLAKVTSLLLI
jgi:CheY-like chemotaxis protein